MILDLLRSHHRSFWLRESLGCALLAVCGAGIVVLGLVMGGPGQ